MITRHDNKNGTTTFRGVNVTIPTSLAETHDVVEVRRAQAGETIEGNGLSLVAQTATRCVFIILKPRPSWKPPAFVAAGRYKWIGKSLFADDGAALWGGNCIRSVYREMTEPSCPGKWQVNADGTATYLGDS